MDWDVDELLAVARLAGYINADTWNNPVAMEHAKRRTIEKLRQGYIPDMEYGKWIKPEEKQND